MVSDSAASIEAPPSRDRPHEEWLRLVQGWRERTGVAAAEEASGDTCDTLFQIEERIADLPAASLAGLKLKARVAQRSEDVGQEWVVGLGAGLVRDILAFTPKSDVDWHAPPPGFMASPAIDPVSFAWIPQGLRIELERLHDIAQAEFRRRLAALHETGNDTPERAAAIHADLFLAPLAAAVTASGAAVQDQVATADPRSGPSLIAMLDLPSATMNELRDIRDIAEHVGAADALAGRRPNRGGERSRQRGRASGSGQ